MKRTYPLIIAVTLLLSSLLLNAQSPAKFNYQAVARNASGNSLTNQAIGVRFTVRDLAVGGNTLYQETHNVTTNSFGLFTAVIGNGTTVSGSLTSISWISGDKFLQVEIDAAGGSNYTDMGTTQLISVPYALQAKEAESITIYPSGTSNPDKVILAHSPALPNSGIIYQDATDVLGFQGNGSHLLDLHLDGNKIDVNANLKISSSTPGAGKVLTSDASGNASWQAVGATQTKAGLNNGNVTVSSTATQLNIGTMTYTKLQSNTELVVELNSRVSSGTFAGGATNIGYELRVDGNATSDGNRYHIFSSGSTEFVTLKSVFKSLAVGSHTIGLYALTNTGTSTNVSVDPGGYTGRLMVKETW
jgi:hypothetical protein